jgi:hypothetical protein
MIWSAMKKTPFALAAASTAILTLAGIGATAAGCGSDKDSSAFPDDRDGGEGGSAGDACTGFCFTPDSGPMQGCVGLECKQVTCDAGTTTSLSGKVFDPAGKVPLYNVIVYVPNEAPKDIAEGASCDRCDGTVTGNPVALTLTDATGAFTLKNVPVAANIPLVMQIGKWRRQITIPTVAQCKDTALDPTTTRLPRNQSEGHIPRMALTTGAADPLECLLRKIGLDDTEFGSPGTGARVHLFAGGGYATSAPDGGPVAYDATGSFADGGAAFAPASGFWGSGTELAKYDVVLMACEGTENAGTKPTAAKQALYDYAKGGGRIFSSHFHEVWWRTSPDTAVQGTATWVDPPHIDPAPKTTAVPATVSTAFPKAIAMHDWLKNTGALDGNGLLPIYETRANVDAVGTNALNWIQVLNPNNMNLPAVQYMSFNTPVGAADSAVCGRVVFSDLHVGAGDATGTPFPDGCTTTDLTPQQRALEFMLFDLSSCVQNDSQATQVK